MLTQWGRIQNNDNIHKYYKEQGSARSDQRRPHLVLYPLSHLMAKLLPRAPQVGHEGTDPTHPTPSCHSKWVFGVIAPLAVEVPSNHLGFLKALVIGSEPFPHPTAIGGAVGGDQSGGFLPRRTPALEFPSGRGSRRSLNFEALLGAWNQCLFRLDFLWRLCLKTTIKPSWLWYISLLLCKECKPPWSFLWWVERQGWNWINNKIIAMERTPLQSPFKAMKIFQAANISLRLVV